MARRRARGAPGGGRIRPIALAAAGAALLVAAFRGAPWWGLVLAAGLWGAVFLAKPLARVLLAAAAALVLTVATPIGARLDLLVSGALLAALALVPLAYELGAPPPTRRAALVATVAIAVCLAFALTPPGAIALRSDLAVGSLTVVAAAGLLLAGAFATQR